MNEPLIWIGRSQMRVSSSRSSEMRLHLNRAGTGPNCSCDWICALRCFAPSLSAESGGLRRPRHDFWLTKLNQFGGNYINPEMVKAFITSIEYRQRFGS